MRLQLFWRFFLLAVAAALCTTGGVRADSLLDETAGDLYSPRTPRVGDLLTVVIIDETNTVQTVTTRARNKTELDAPGGEGLLAFLPGFGLNNEGNQDRQESASTVSRFQDTITARVVAVEENGLLVVEASRRIDLDGQERTVTLRGRVRPQDVEADNRVASSRLADAEIRVEGLKASPVHKGLITTILNFLL